MPTYIYKFTETGETIEVQQAFSDASLTEAVHPGTGQVMAVKKVFTPVGVTFKGGGFYKTDSRGGKSKSTVPSSTSGSDGASSGSGSGSSDGGSSGKSDTAAPSSTPAATPSTSGTSSSSAASSS